MEQRLISDDKCAIETAHDIYRQLQQAVDGGASSLVLGLSGGSSPKKLYYEFSKLCSSSIAQKLLLVQIDERVVAPHDENSNQRLIYEYTHDLLQKGAKFYHVDILDDNHKIQSPSTIAEKYNNVIEQTIGTADYCLAILGIGADGHTASIFPSASDEEKILAEGKNFVFATLSTHLEYYRISLTYSALFSFDKLLFYVPGANKKDIVDKIITPNTKSYYPASYVLYIHPQSTLIISS